MQQQAEISEMHERLRAGEAEQLQQEAELSAMKEAINTKKAEAEREHRKRERLEKEVRDLKATLEQKASEIKQKQLQISASEEQQTKLSSMLAMAKASSEKMTKEFTQLNERVVKLHVDLEEQVHQNTLLLADNCQKQVALKNKDEEITAMKAETLRVTKLRDQTHKKIKSLEEQRDEIENTRDTLKAGANLVLSASAFVLQNCIGFSWILRSYKCFFLIIKINNFRGELTDTSAKTYTLISASC